MTIKQCRKRVVWRWFSEYVVARHIRAQLASYHARVFKPRNVMRRAAPRHKQRPFNKQAKRLSQPRMNLKAFPVPVPVNKQWLKNRICELMVLVCIIAIVKHKLNPPQRTMTFTSRIGQRVISRVTCTNEWVQIQWHTNFPNVWYTFKTNRLVD